MWQAKKIPPSPPFAKGETRRWHSPASPFAKGGLRGIFFILLLSPLPALAAFPSFQALVDATAEGGILTPPAGTYAGPVVINKPMQIDGRNEVTIDGGGKGTVVVLKTDNATLKNLHLTNSGVSHNDIDSGVQVRGKNNVIKDSVIDDCLFGVDLQQSESNVVRRNHISSKPFELGLRGDSVRLWYSFYNKITDNIVEDSRDMVVWYSANNEIQRNKVTDSRYSLHFMYSKTNLVEDNEYYNNAVGIFLMYSDGVVVRNNSITHAAGPTGVGIGFKETSDLIVENNKVLYCASGFYIDMSPFQPDTTNQFKNNLLAYNDIGVRFLNDWRGNTFQQNQFVDNMTPVVVSGRGTANNNVWDGNYWSDYQGFDRDANGVGDTPHEIYSYADRLWQQVSDAQFFKGSPLLEALDFLERLAPFSKPTLLIRDKTPRMAMLQAMPAAVVKPQKKDALEMLLEAQQ